jgi:hypothetical protein
MQEYLWRSLHLRVGEAMRNFPAVAILGPRQCGKTTLALEIAKESGPSVYVDLERPTDTRKLTDPETYFRQHQERLVCLDESWYWRRQAWPMGKRPCISAIVVLQAVEGPMRKADWRKIISC